MNELYREMSVSGSLEGVDRVLEKIDKFNLKYGPSLEISPDDLERSFEGRNRNLAIKEITGGVEENYDLLLNHSIKVIGGK